MARAMLRRLVVLAALWATLIAGVALVPAAANAAVPASDVATSCWVNGTITSYPDLAPVPNLEVLLIANHSSVYATTTTDATGYFMEPNLPPGPWDVEFYDPSGQWATPAWWSTTFGYANAWDIMYSDLLAGEGLNASVSLERAAHIRGTVTDAISGKPVGGVTVQAWPYNPPNTSPTGLEAYATTAPDGSFAIDGLYAHDFTLTCSSDDQHLPGFYTAGETTDGPVVFTLTADQTLSGADMALKPWNHVKGSVVNSDTGEPAAGITVSAFKKPAAGWSGSPAFTADATTVTASDGSYDIKLLNGTYRLQFSGHDGSGLNYRTQYWLDQPNWLNSGDLTVKDGSVFNDIDAHMIYAGSITGHVTDAMTHLAVPGITVHGIDAYSGHYTGQAATTDSNGNFSVDDLKPAYFYKVEYDDERGLSPGYDTPMYFSASSATGTPSLTQASLEYLDPTFAFQGGANIQLQEGGHIKGTVTEANTSKLLAGVSVVAYEPGGSADNPDKTAATKSDGTYDLSGLEDGTYLVKFVPTDGLHVPQWYNRVDKEASATTVVIAGSSTSTGVNGVLTASRLQGRVLETEDHPLKDVTVYVKDVDANTVVDTIYTDADGSFYSTSDQIKDGHKYVISAELASKDGKLAEQVTNVVVWWRQEITYHAASPSPVVLDCADTLTFSACLYNSPAAYWKLASEGAVWYYLQKNRDVAISEGVDLNRPVTVFAWDPAGSCYYQPGPAPSIHLTVDAMLNAPTLFEKNRETHEFGHAVMDVIDNYVRWPNPSVGNHDGYINATSSDSFIEGFAEYWAMHVDEMKQLSGNSAFNIECDPSSYDVWGRVGATGTPDAMMAWSPMNTAHPLAEPRDFSQEEFAFAGVLWNLEAQYGGGDAGFAKIAAALPAAQTVTGFHNALAPSAQTDAVFFSHGFFDDTNGDWIHEPGEPIGSGNGTPCDELLNPSQATTTCPARPARQSRPYEPDSFLRINLSDVSGGSDATFVRVQLTYPDPSEDYTWGDVVFGSSGLVYLHISPDATAQVTVQGPGGLTSPQTLTIPGSAWLADRDHVVDGAALTATFGGTRIPAWVTKPGLSKATPKRGKKVTLSATASQGTLSTGGQATFALDRWVSKKVTKLVHRKRKAVTVWSWVRWKTLSARPGARGLVTASVAFPSTGKWRGQALLTSTRVYSAASSVIRTFTVK